MRKIFCAFLMLMVLNGCVSSAPEGYKQCPLVTIKREDARLIQIVNYQDNFEIELVGMEGFCYYDTRVKQEKAKITPIFVINKLRNTDESDVQFRWFTNTIKGPPAYLGKKTYFVETSLKKDERRKEFKGAQVEVKIPVDMMYEFEIFAGLEISPRERKYNQRIFDVELGYFEEETSEPYSVKVKEQPAIYYEDGTPADPENLKNIQNKSGE